MQNWWVGRGQLIERGSSLVFLNIDGVQPVIPPDTAVCDDMKQHWVASQVKFLSF